MSVALFSAIMLGLGVGYSALANNYGFSAEGIAAFNQTSGLLNELKQDQQNITDNLEATEYIVFNPGAFNAIIGFITNIPSMINGLISDTAQALGLDQWVTTIVYVILGLIVIMAIIYAFVRVRI